MIHSILKDKPTKLFLGITAFFVANALIAECIGGKIFSLEKVLIKYSNKSIGFSVGCFLFILVFLNFIISVGNLKPLSLYGKIF